MHPLASLRLKNKADRRLRGGHVWVYSNEVDVAATPLKQFQAGEQVRVESAQGKCLGIAMVSPNNLICARLVSRDESQMLDGRLLRDRLHAALQLRESFCTEPFYRLVYGDSDQLPGLVVDRFGDYLVVQLATAGMERLADEIIAALVDVLSPKGILFKNDARIRGAENLPAAVEIVYGEVPEQLELIENGVRFRAPVFSGQKTGWFYDHRCNRARLRDYVAEKTVLDVFSYIGGWGVQAAAFGAQHVTCVDSSEAALEGVRNNAALNGVADKVECLAGAAFEVMKQLIDAQRRFDVVIIDPPAFIPRRKDIRQGEQAYHRANALALRLVAPGGFLVSASCSMHLSRTSLVDVLRVESRHVDRSVRIVEQGGQGFDHPVHPAIAETDYLKAVFALVSLNR